MSKRTRRNTPVKINNLDTFLEGREPQEEEVLQEGLMDEISDPKNIQKAFDILRRKWSGKGNPVLILVKDNEDKIKEDNEGNMDGFENAAFAIGLEGMGNNKLFRVWEPAETTWGVDNWFESLRQADPDRLEFRDPDTQVYSKDNIPMGKSSHRDRDRI